MSVWRGIEYVEAAPTGPNEQYGTDASRVLRTLYFTERPTIARRQEIARAFIGYAEVKVATKGLTTFIYLSRTTPHFYPAIDFRGPYLWCQSLVGSEMVTADGVETTALHAGPADDLTATSEWWKATFEYRTCPFDVKEDSAVVAVAGELGGYPDEGDALRRGWVNTRYISKMVEPGGRVIPLRQGVLKYAGVLDARGQPVPTMEPFPFNETLAHVNYFWAGIPLSAYPLGVVQASLNTVNTTTFDGYHPGTLLLLDAREVPRIDAFGQRVLDVTYRMLWAQRQRANAFQGMGHNAILRVSAQFGAEWTLVSSDGSIDPDKYPYRNTDFSKLFHPSQT